MGEGWEGKEARKINKQENTGIILHRIQKGGGRREGGGGGGREERKERDISTKYMYLFLENLLFGRVIELIFSSSFKTLVHTLVCPQSLHLGNKVYGELDVVCLASHCDYFPSILLGW